MNYLQRKELNLHVLQFHYSRLTVFIFFLKDAIE